MKIENSFSVGGDVHLGTARDGSATFLGGTLEVDGVSMFGKDMELFSADAQSIVLRLIF